MENVSFKEAKIVKSPKDTVLDGVITKMSIVTWNELLENVSQEKRDKFKDLNAKRYLFEFEVLYEGRHIKGNTHVAHYPLDAIPEGSNIELIINKYGEDITAGTKVKVDFNDKGIASLRF